MSAMTTASAFGVAAPLRATAQRRTARGRCVAPVRAVGPTVSPNSEAVKIANSVGLTGLEVRGRNARSRGLGRAATAALACTRLGAAFRETPPHAAPSPPAAPAVWRICALAGAARVGGARAQLRACG